MNARSRSWSAAACVAALVALAVPAAFARPAAGARAPHATPSPQPVAPLFGLCDATGVLEVLGDLGDPSAGKKRAQIALLQGRIVDCARKIRAFEAAAPRPAATPYWVSAAAPAPAATPSEACTNPPPATTGSDRFALFEILQRCSAYWATVNPPASPAPGATPLPSVASRPTFYVFATGAADAPSATVLVRSVVASLGAAQARSTAGAVAVSGRADWTATESFTSQCQLDPNTRGALVIQTSLPATYRRNYFLLVANFTTVAASIEVLGCGPGAHSPAASPLSLFGDQSVTGAAHEDALTLGIFSSIAAYLALDRSRTTVTTGKGSTTITRTDSTSPALTGSVLGYLEGENLTLPAQNPSVELTVAGQRFAADAMNRLHAACRAPALHRLAGQADPSDVQAPPLEHRRPLYEAAFEYANDCALFADFAP